MSIEVMLIRFDSGADQITEDLKEQLLACPEISVFDDSSAESFTQELWRRLDKELVGRYKYVVVMSGEMNDAYYHDGDKKLRLNLCLAEMIKRKEVIVAIVKLSSVNQLPSRRLELCHIIEARLDERGKLMEDTLGEVRRFVFDRPCPLREVLPLGNVASALAWSYYTRYLYPVLSQWCDINWHEYRSQPACPLDSSIFLFDKYIIITNHENLTRTLAERDRHFIRHVLEKDRATPYKIHFQSHRKFSFDVILIQHPEDEAKQYYVIAEYITPFHALLDLTESAYMAFDQRNRIKEAADFLLELRAILRRDCPESAVCRQCSVLHTVPDDTRSGSLARSLVQLVEKCVNHKSVAAVDQLHATPSQVLFVEGPHADMMHKLIDKCTSSRLKITFPEQGFNLSQQFLSAKWICFLFSNALQDTEEAVALKYAYDKAVDSQTQCILVILLDSVADVNEKLPRHLSLYSRFVRASSQNLTSPHKVKEICDILNSNVPALEGLPTPDMGEALAVSHFFGWLNLILPKINDSFVLWKKNFPDKPLARKMLSFVPMNNSFCLDLRIFEKNDFALKVPINILNIYVTSNRAGQTGRPYPPPFFLVRDPDFFPHDLNFNTLQINNLDDLRRVVMRKEVFVLLCEVPGPCWAMLSEATGGLAGLCAEQLSNNLNTFAESQHKLLSYSKLLEHCTTERLSGLEVAEMARKMVDFCKTQSFE